MSELDVACRALVQGLHDEIRADMPCVKVLGRSLVPPPWTADRIDAVARLVVDAVRCGAREEINANVDEMITVLNGVAR